MDCHFLIQGIFLTQGSNPGLLHCRQPLYHLSHPFLHRRPWFNSWIGTLCWRRDGLPTLVFLGFPWGTAGKESLQCGRPEFNPWVRKIPWRRKWQPTPVFLRGKFHGQRSLVGYSPWGRQELDRTEHRPEPSCLSPLATLGLASTSVSLLLYRFISDFRFHL